MFYTIKLLNLINVLIPEIIKIFSAIQLIYFLSQTSLNMREEKGNLFSPFFQGHQVLAR